MGSVIGSVRHSTLTQIKSRNISIMKLMYFCTFFVISCQMFSSVPLPTNVLRKPCTESHLKNKVDTPCGDQNDFYGLLRNPQRQNIKVKRVYDVIPSSMNSCRYDSRGRSPEVFWKIVFHS